ncbi:polycomb protein Sfmbt-like isoform X3 [Ctenocephalides felis]|uniref:polycomb protein Sfmbt-like isoform X3 n=1 Tax=Ctenocephalides felis TaxID=7515 RepID=UPI000E6E2EB4|nr:polycomb protein Sfmbt-like isoform X3 [Ctenocephalides felis]
MYTLPGATPELGMVWMGAEHFMMEDSPFYATGHSNQSLDDVVSRTNPMEIDTYSMLDYTETSQNYDNKIQDSEENYKVDEVICDEIENGNAPMTQSMGTQTAQATSRKIKPVKHPGLVLKTPIAYQRDTDPSVIPIQKDGMAICEKCGAIGVKHAFYTRERRFCSLACARVYSGLDPEPSTHIIQNTNNMQSLTSKSQIKQENSSEANEDEFQTSNLDSFLDIKPIANPNYKFKMECEDDFSNVILPEKFPQLASAPEISQLDETAQSVRRKSSEFSNSYDWTSQLNDLNFMAAPVTCFKHAPVYEIWGNITVGMKVEVENTDCDNISDNLPDSFWVATVLRIIGYKALMRYEGFANNDTKDFWVNLCTAEVHPVGWCATRGKPLIPPKTIQNKYNDWKEFLVKRLTGARTLPSTFYNKVSDSLKSRFHCGLNLEVVDKNRISQVKVAVVRNIIGKRLHVCYYDSTPEDNGFWCHEDSPLIHPVGWAKKVGHNIDAPMSYLLRVNSGILNDEDAPEELFKNGLLRNNVPSKFRVGMKLEAIDPLNLSTICVATVMQVLRYGYIMIKIDNYAADPTGADWFCYHESSPCIFPVGFCAANNILLTPPYLYNAHTFSWDLYLQETGNLAAYERLFDLGIPEHGFIEGMKLECADLMDPRLVCVATIARVVGRLLKVQFDGWDAEYDQWLDCESPDIYPVGWCVMVGHKLEGPHVPQKQTSIHKISPKGNKKKTGRKKKTKPETNLNKSMPAGASNTSKSINALKNNSLRISNNKDYTANQSESCHRRLSSKFENADLDKSILVEETAVKEPEAAPEPIGPDQNLPVSSEPQIAPPSERKATSYINNTGCSSNKLIPRLVDSAGFGDLTGELDPKQWNVFDVAQFLRVNDCATYCDTFSKNKIDGTAMLDLTKDEIILLLGMKVGPSLKIFDLIQQLKCKINPAQSRLLKATLNNKFL